MALDINDPELTAYALGELEGDERASVEAEIAASPELQQAVDEIRRAGVLLAESLAAEASPELTAADREAILRHWQDEAGTSLTKQADPVGRPRWTTLAAAACLLIAAGLLAAFYQVSRQPRLITLNELRSESAPATKREQAALRTQDEAEETEAVQEEREFLRGTPGLQRLQEDRGRTDLGRSAGADATSDSKLMLGSELQNTWDAAEADALRPSSGSTEGIAPSSGPADEQQDFEQYSADMDGNLSSLRGLRESATPQAQPASPARGGAGMRFSRDLADTADAYGSAGGAQVQVRDGSFEYRDGSVEYDDRRRSERLSSQEGRPSATSYGFGLSGTPAQGAAEPSAPGAAGSEPSSSGLLGEERLLRQRQADMPAVGVEAATEEAELDMAGEQLQKELQENGAAGKLEDLRLQLRAARPQARSAPAAGEAERAEQQSAQNEAGQNGQSEQQKRNNEAKGAVSASWKRSRVTPHASRLMIGDQDELPLKGMQVNVFVDGFRARVLLDCYYYNDRQQQLEGTFQLRLPTDASLHYFAFGETVYQYRPMIDGLATSGVLSSELVRGGVTPESILRSRADSWSNVKEARVVPRVKAAHAYGEVVRRRVDPALVEWTGAGVFNASVFPLMPGKLHRIVIGYDTNLTSDGNDLVYQLDLPEPRPECMVDLNVAALPGTTAEVMPATQPFTSGGRAYYHFLNPTEDAVAVRLKDPGTVLLTGKDPQAGEFFATRLRPELPAEGAEAADHALLLVDTSLSGNPDKFNVWRQLAPAVLEQNRSSIKRFKVLFFSVDTHWWKDEYVDNTAESVAELRRYMDSLVLEGATDLRAAVAEATSQQGRRDGDQQDLQPDVFLFSDGAATWGDLDVAQIARPLEDKPFHGLFAYRTGMAGSADHVLQQLVATGGGAVFSIVQEAELSQVATAHQARPWEIVNADVPGGQDVLIAGRARQIYPGQTVLLAGRGTPGQEAVLTVRQGDRKQQVRLMLDRRVSSELTPRVYGEIAVGRMEDLQPDDQDVTIAYARHFRVTGQTCSLLMLESEADYQRFKIGPEDDAFVVKSSQASELIQKELAAQSDRVEDPKQALRAWLAELERMPGFQFQLSTAFRLALEGLPAEALQISPTGLDARVTQRGDVPDAYLEQLVHSGVDYRAMVAEAERRRAELGTGDGLKVLSNLIEAQPGDWVLARDVAFTAMDWGLPAQAYPLLERVVEARPYEPQAYLAAARSLAEMDRTDLAMVYYEVAVGGKWNDRYRDIQKIASMEYLSLLKQVDRGQRSSHMKPYAQARLEALTARVPVQEADLVVVMMWNTDRTDIDLHIKEPSGEECYYEHPTTRSGGRLTADVTEGFGPEMYYVPTAQEGSYEIKAHYYGSDANRTQVRSKVYLTIYRDFGKPGEHIMRHVVALDEQKEMQTVATVGVKSDS